MSQTLKSFDLHGRVAVVTGGAGLLGRQFCQTLAEAGAQVVVADLNADSTAQVATEINRLCAQGESISAAGLPTDVSSKDSVQALVTETLKRFGRLDILVNSAALDPKFDPQNLGKDVDHGGDGAFETYPLEAWNQALQVNLTGMFLCCQAAVRPMLQQGRGVIINICSMYGLVGPDQRLYQRPGQPPQFKPVYYPLSGRLLRRKKYPRQCPHTRRRLQQSRPRICPGLFCTRHSGPHGPSGRNEWSAALPGI